MKALLIALLPVLYLKWSLSTDSPLQSVKSVLCQECMQSGSYECEEVKECNSTNGFCHIIFYEGRDGHKSIRQSCATNCELPTSLFINAKMYHALCCTFDFCNQFQYSREVMEFQPNIAVSGLTSSVFWAHFRVILQYIGLED